MDIPPTHIMQISGHKKVQCINNYSNVSQEKQRNMSLKLSSSSTPAEVGAKAPRTSTATDHEAETLWFVKSPVMPSTGLFSGAVIHLKINTDI